MIDCDVTTNDVKHCVTYGGLNDSWGTVVVTPQRLEEHFKALFYVIRYTAFLIIEDYYCFI